MKMEVNVIGLKEEAEVEITSFPRGKRVKEVSSSYRGGSYSSPDERGTRSEMVTVISIPPIEVTVTVEGKEVRGCLRGELREDGVSFAKILVSELTLGGRSANDKIGIPAIAKFAYDRPVWELLDITLNPEGVIRR